MSGDLPIGITEERKLPPERFASAVDLRQCCQQMIDADRKRMWLRERVDNLVNGFASYPKSALQKKGMGWFPRVNYRESEGLIQAQQTPLFDLLTEVDHCIEIDLDIEAESNEEKQDWQRKIQKAFTWLMFKRWRKSFNFHLPLSQREMLVHGIGAHVWPHKTRWTPRTPRTGQILFPDNCSLDYEDNMKYFMLRDFVPGEDVYAFIRKEETAGKLGWYPDNVWKALTQASKQNLNPRRSGGRDVDEVQRKFRRGDIGFSQSSQVGLMLNWVFVKEYEGGISLYCIDENITVGSKDKGYLFRKRFQFDSWPLTLFNYDVGNGDIHSVRGLGVRSKDYFELSNRLTNAMVAQVLISAFPQVKQIVRDVDPDKLKLMRLGALSIIPYGVDYGMMNFPPLGNTGLALSRELREKLETNNQSVAGSTPEPKDRETAYSFSVRSQDMARVSNGQQSLYESNLQCFYDRMYRMVIRCPKGEEPYQKMAEEFRERCRREKVPDKALTERAIGEIRENTSTGAGSAALRMHALLTLWQYIYPTVGDDKKITIERAITSALMGNANVDQFARSIHDSELPTQDVSLAEQESNGLALGGDAIIGVRQDDAKHADNHLTKAEMIEQQVEQGQMEPEQAFKALQKLLDHAGEHLSRLQNNPQKQDEFKALEQRWKKLAQFAKQLQNEIESSKGEPSPEQQMSEDAQVKTKKDEMENQRKTRKDDMDMTRKFRKDVFSERMADAKTASQINRNGKRPAKAR